MASLPHPPKVPTEIDFSRKNVEDLMTAFFRQKYKGLGIENCSFTFDWTKFVPEVRATIKRIK